jgi:predicted permease
MRVEQWLYQIPLRLRSLFRRNNVEAELSEELRNHVEQLTEANLASGMTLHDARAAALLSLRGIEQYKEECRDVRGVSWLENLGRDLRYAARTLRKTPGFTCVAILSLALGIGANTAIFSLIDTLLIRPLPVPYPERLRIVELNRGNGYPQAAITYTLFDALRSHNQAFSALFTWSNHSFQMKSGEDMIHVNGMLASGDYFSGLGVAPLVGRTFTVSDDHPSGGKDGPVAVISENFWQRQFQRNLSPIGSELTLDRVAFTIIGVMPQSFFGADVDFKPDIWVPLQMASRVDDPGCITSRSCWWLITMGRLKDGVKPQQADTSLASIGPAVLRDSLPPWNAKQQSRFLSMKLGSISGEEGWSGLRMRFSHPLEILMTLVGLVLAIACANMANLLLARSLARQREIGVRLAMGAGRGRVIRQLLTESVLLSLIGSTAGAALSVALTRFMTAFIQAGSRFSADVQLDLHPDWRVVLFALVLAVGTGMLFGLAPAFRATKLGIGAALKESSNNLQGHRPNHAVRFTLAFQAAFSVLLIASAGLFAGSLHRLLTLNMGFNPKSLMLVNIDTDKRPEKGEALTTLYSNILSRINASPGIDSASLVWITPLSNGGWDEDVTVPGEPSVPEPERDTYGNVIGPRFFSVMGIPLLSGREFTEGDAMASDKVCIINRVAAHRFFPHGSPLGMELKMGSLPLRVIGVVGDIKYLNLRDNTPPEIYLPYTQKADGMPSLTFVIKTSLPGATLYSEFRTALRSVASDVPIGRVRKMDDQVYDSVGRERMMASLSIFFGLLALLLTAIGLHGILAYSVTRRTSEIGIRMALGAQLKGVVWLIVSETAGFVAVGIVVGVAAVLVLSKLAAGLLYGIQPNDPGNLFLAIASFVAVAISASWLPAARAAKLDPTRALREE